jgi:hypothetical protein
MWWTANDTFRCGLSTIAPRPGNHVAIVEKRSIIVDPTPSDFSQKTFSVLPPPEIKNRSPAICRITMVTVVCNETIGILVLVILPYIWRDIVSWLFSWFVVLANSKMPPPASSSRRTGGRSQAAEEAERGKVTNGSSPENPLVHPEGGLERSNQTVCTESLTSHEGEEEDEDDNNDREERLTEGRRSSSGRGSRTTGDHHYHHAANNRAGGSKTVLRCSSPKRRTEPQIMEPFYDEISHEFSSTDNDPNDFSNTIRTNDDDDDDHCDDDDVSEDAYIVNRRSIDEQEDEESEDDDDTTTSMDLDELQQSCSVSSSALSPHQDRNDKTNSAGTSSDPPAALHRRLAKSDSCLVTLTATPKTTAANRSIIIAPAYCQVSQHLRRKLCSTTTSNNNSISRGSLVGGGTTQQSSSFSSVSHHSFSSSSSPRLHSSHSRQSSLLYPTTTTTSSARLYASTSRLPSYTSPKQQPRRRKQPPNSMAPKNPPSTDASSADSNNNNHNNILNARSVYLRQQFQQRGISISTSTPLSHCSSSSSTVAINNNNNSKVQVQQQQRGPTSSLQRDRDLLKRRLTSGC